MFFDAMKRKGYKSEVADMKTVVPIHNAVNERAWREIRAWERPWGSEQKYVASYGHPQTVLGYMNGLRWHRANEDTDAADPNYTPSSDCPPHSPPKHDSTPGWATRRPLIDTIGLWIDVVREWIM